MLRFTRIATPQTEFPRSKIFCIRVDCAIAFG
ncbi:hypothetical protein HCH_01613 [Hahella chejuensis KCTC 2396]|uniref:Uncharacterized protein n=1 Tax=Hahella chejuensis (strain KCTC 2396) TaxID=349521 RepID=Q2SLK4_HAHCH|nr:hypothetical protein HCH_01613 [Hahella chejuensis KCTC 2396]